MPTQVTAHETALDPVVRFVMGNPQQCRMNGLTVVSLFSGGGLSDTGYVLAGFNIVVQAELALKRAEIGKRNFPGSAWIVGDVRKTANEIITTYKATSKAPLGLLVATPPCQGLSSSNPAEARGLRRTLEKTPRRTRSCFGSFMLLGN